MSDIREKIMAIEPPDQFNSYERFGFNFGIGQAAACAKMETEAEVRRLEALLVDVSAKAASCGYELAQKEREVDRLEKALRYIVRLYLVPDDYNDEEEMKTRTDEAYNSLLRRMCEASARR